jgi:predicted Zn-dependent peptidase
MGWFTVTMGTRPQNISESLDGIEKEVEKFREFAFSENGVQKAKNSYIGRLVMRRLSRINAAYYYGLYESQGYGYDYFTKHVNDLKKVTVDDVQHVAKKYLQTKNYILAVTE